MKVKHNAKHVNLTKNMRNSQNIINITKGLTSQEPTQQLCTNVMGNHNIYYRNVYDIPPGFLAVAAVNKYFPHAPKESIVILSTCHKIPYKLHYFWHIYKTYDLVHTHFSSSRPITRDLTEYIKNPEGILVTSIPEFQGAQARNIIICDEGKSTYQNLRNTILRTISNAIIILRKEDVTQFSSGAHEDENLHEYIYPEGKAPECLHYHNKDKHDISSMTMAILDKYKLLDKDEGIVIVTYNRISKDIMREANTEEFLSLIEGERIKQVNEKIASENQEKYEDVIRNISRNYAGMSWSYFVGKIPTQEINQPRYINYVVIGHNYKSNPYEFSETKNIIVFTDENTDHKHEFAAWGRWYTLKNSDKVISIDIDKSKKHRNGFDVNCRNLIMTAKPKFALVVHDEKFEMFSGPKGALNLNEDKNLDEYIPVEALNLIEDTNLDEYIPVEDNKSSTSRITCKIKKTL